MHHHKKTAFVTGGTRGIGRGIVKVLASSGYNVVFTYKTEKSLARSLIAETSKLNSSVISVQMDLQDRLSIKESIEVAKKNFKHIDILVNNAAIAQEIPFESISDSDWENMLKINLQGPFILVQELIPEMLENSWGRIVNISSIGGQWGGLNQVHYAAAKAGLINFTRSIAKLYSKDGITSNAIAPGLIETEMSAAELKSDAGKEKVKNIPSNRIGYINEVGYAVRFLASKDAEYITGQTINLNGGMFFST